MRIDCFEQITEKLICLVVRLRRTDGWTADDDRAFEGGKEGDLAVLWRANQSPEIGKARMLGEDIEVVLKRLGAVGLRDCGKAGFFHDCIPCARCVQRNTIWR